MCGDFNARSTLWGGVRTDANREVNEELLVGKDMVCLNDGRGTKLDVHTGNSTQYSVVFGTRFNFHIKKFSRDM